jgi:hypothetical protein
MVDYARALGRIPATYGLLEAATYKMHSLSTLTELLPRDLAVTSWALGSVFIVAAVVLVWRSIAEWRVRFGVLVLASVLVSPHVGIYDLALLALPAVWLGGWMEESGLPVDGFWQRSYWIAAATLVPTAAFLRIQLSVVLMIELFVQVVVAAMTYARTVAAVSSRNEPRRRPMSL